MLTTTEQAGGPVPQPGKQAPPCPATFHVHESLAPTRSKIRGRGGKGDNNLKQRTPVWVRRKPRFCHHVLERHIIIGNRSQNDIPRLPQEFTERRVATEIHA